MSVCICTSIISNGNQELQQSFVVHGAGCVGLRQHCLTARAQWLQECCLHQASADLWSLPAMCLLGDCHVTHAHSASRSRLCGSSTGGGAYGQSHDTPSNACLARTDVWCSCPAACRLVGWLAGGCGIAHIFFAHCRTDTTKQQCLLAESGTTASILAPQQHTHTHMTL